MCETVPVCVSVCLCVCLSYRPAPSPSGLMMTAQPLQLAQLAVQHLLDLLDPADRVDIITVRGDTY